MSIHFLDDKLSLPRSLVFKQCDSKTLNAVRLVCRQLKGEADDESLYPATTFKIKCLYKDFLMWKNAFERTGGWNASLQEMMNATYQQYSSLKRMAAVTAAFVNLGAFAPFPGQDLDLRHVTARAMMGRLSDGAAFIVIRDTNEDIGAVRAAISVCSKTKELTWLCGHKFSPHGESLFIVGEKKSSFQQAIKKMVHEGIFFWSIFPTEDWKGFLGAR